MTALASDLTVGQLVTERPARSRVFQKLGIDFCCGGKKSLEDACRQKGLDPQSVLAVLQAMDDDAAGSEVDAGQMTLTELCDHIESAHHAYLKEELPRLHRMIAKVATVHGDWCPFMRQVFEVYVNFMDELSQHMMKEEQILFPIIRRLEAEPATVAAGSVAGPIRVMEQEHDGAGDALAQMRELTDGFTPPPQACNTFRATLDGLRELEADMHQHVHKENNVLFPRAIEREARGS